MSGRGGGKRWGEGIYIRSTCSSYSSDSAICTKDKSHGELRMCRDFRVGV